MALRGLPVHRNEGYEYQCTVTFTNQNYYFLRKDKKKLPLTLLAYAFEIKAISWLVSLFKTCPFNYLHSPVQISN